MPAPDWFTVAQDHVRARVIKPADAFLYTVMADHAVFDGARHVVSGLSRIDLARIMNYAIPRTLDKHLVTLERAGLVSKIKGHRLGNTYLIHPDPVWTATAGQSLGSPYA